MTSVAGEAQVAYGTLPKNWTRRRLRFDAQLNPKKSSIDIEPDELVSFVAMDAVGEYGGMNLDDVRELEDVYNGYTYFADGDICVAKITPCFENGKGAIAEGLTNGVGFGTTELHVIRPEAGIDRRYLFYVTIADDFRKVGESEMYGAGGQKRINEGFIKDWMPPLPPLNTQQRIAQFLDEKTAQIDGLIEKKRALLDRLAEKRQALITRAVTKGLNPDVPMKPSGIGWLGDVPRNWAVQRLRFSVEMIEQGWSPQCDSQSAEPGEWGVLKVGCVNGEHYDENENKVLPPDLDPVERYEVRNGDILISRANTRELLGSAALVEDTQGKIIFCDKLYRLTLTDEIEAEYLVGILRSPLSRLQYEREATGTSGSMQNIGQDTIKNLIHPLPPREEQRIIGQAIQVIRNESTHMEGKVSVSIDKLTEYRTAVIAAAVTGQFENLR